MAGIGRIFPTLTQHAEYQGRRASELVSEVAKVLGKDKKRESQRELTPQEVIRGAYAFAKRVQCKTLDKIV